MSRKRSSFAGDREDDNMSKKNQSKTPETSTDTVRVKKYQNRKIYSEATGAYITMLELSDLVADGKVVQVTCDATGKDLTLESLARALYERVRDRQPGPNDPVPADFEALIRMIKRLGS